MKKLTVLAPILLLPLFASLCGCGAQADNTPLPKGEVPDWRQKNQQATDHPHDPNLPPGEK